MKPGMDLDGALREASAKIYGVRAKPYDEAGSPCDLNPTVCIGRNLKRN